MKQRLPRKLKKAAHLCVSYYDGYMVALPIWKYEKWKPRRHTKWMHRICDRYWPYWDYINGFESKGGHRRGELIDGCLCYIYYAKRHYRKNAKYHRLRGEIFTYCWQGVVFPGGAWVPKVKPKDTYHRCCFPGKDIPENEKYIVEHEEYSYKELRHVRVEKFYITKEEFDNKEISAKKLFMKYLDERLEELIKC